MVEGKKSGGTEAVSPKNLWYMHLACLDSFFGNTFFFTFSLFVFAVLLGAGGLWTGLSCLATLLLFVGCSLWSKRVAEYFYKPPPLISMSLILTEYAKYKKELIKIGNKYLQDAHPKGAPLKELFPFYLFVILLIMVNPYFSDDQLVSRIILGVMLGFFFFMLSSIYREIKSFWIAKDPRRISKYFGIPEWKWNVNKWSIPRSFYAKAVAWQFVGIAALLLYSGIALTIRGATHVALPIPFISNLGGGWGVDIVLGLVFAFLTFFPALTAYWLRKMLKAGLWLALVMTMVSLFTGTLLAFDSVVGTNVFRAPFYYFLAIIGISLIAIVLLKLSWHEFVEDRWTAFRKYAPKLGKST